MITTTHSHKHWTDEGGHVKTFQVFSRQAAVFQHEFNRGDRLQAARLPADPAPGADLACLIRRLRDRLQCAGDQLVCVGTSATLGGPESREAMHS